MKKKLLSLIMAVAMIASMALPALASSTSTQTTSTATDGVYSANTTISSQTRIAIVKVTLPAATAANKVILNPYELKLNASTSGSSQSLGAADDAAATAAGAASPQVITVPLEIKSESDVPLMVGVKAKATVGGDTKLSATHVDQSLVGTDKNLFLYLDMIRAKDGVQVAAADWAADTAPKWHDDPSKVNTNAFSQVIPTSSGEQKDKLFVIPAGDGTATTPKYAYFKIMGSTAPAPKKDWAATDTVSLELAFTFSPTKLYGIQAHKSGAKTAAGADYTVNFGDSDVTIDSITYNAQAAAGTPVVLKAKDKNVFTDVSIIKPDDAVNGTKEDDEVRAATAVKVTDDTYYFIMPAERVVVRAGIEPVS